jgi:hypothetical protein
MGLIDVCTGAVQYDPTFLLNDSLYAMAFTIHPTTGLGYLVRGFNQPFRVYTYNFTTKVQTLTNADFGNFNTVGIARQAAMNPLDTTKLYIVFTQAEAGPSQLVVMNTSNWTLLAVHNLSVSGLYSIAFNSSGSAYMFTGFGAADSVECYALNLVAFTLSLFTSSVGHVNHMRPVIALNPSYATCLQQTGLPGRLVLTDIASVMAVYQDPGVDLFSDGNTVVVNAQSFANAQPPITAFNFAFMLPIDAVNATVDILINGTRSRERSFPYVELVYPWSVFASDTSSMVLPGAYNVTCFYVNATAQSPSVVRRVFVRLSSIGFVVGVD